MILSRNVISEGLQLQVISARMASHRLGSAVKSWCEQYVESQHYCDTPGDEQGWYLVESCERLLPPTHQTYCCPECGELWARSERR
jgi:hypothetical protein